MISQILRRRSILHATISILMLAAATLRAEDENWPRWRGPRNDGVSLAKNPPVKFSQSENVAWRSELPGAAGSTPIVWNDRIFLSSAEGKNIVLLCLDQGGKKLWTQLLSVGNRAIRRDEGNFASPSP